MWKNRLSAKTVNSPVLVRPEPSFGADQVTEVKQLGEFEVIVANLVLADEDLDVTGPVSQRQEDQFSLAARKHDAACHADAGTAFCPRSVIRFPLAVVELRIVEIRQRNVRTILRVQRISELSGWQRPIIVRSSKRPPNGSSPRASICRNFSRRATRGSLLSWALLDSL